MITSKDLSDRSLRKFRLRTTLVVPFVLQIVAAVGLVWFIAYRSGQKAINDVASQLRTELSNRITEKLDSYIEIPKSINRLNATAFARGDIDVSNPRGEHLFWQQMQSYPTLSFMYCGDEEGGFFGVRRLSEQDPTQVILQFSNSDTNFIRQGFGFDSQGDRTMQQIGTFDKPFDPRTRPWYEAAKAAGGEVWSEIYLSFSTLFPTVTASVPVYDQTSTLIGVCATDFFLPQELSIFLQNLEIGKTGTAFIVERSGRLVATSSQEQMVTGSGEQSERLLATTSTNANIRGTAEYLNTQFSNLNQIQSVQQLDFKLNGERQYVQVVPFQDRNLDWLVILTIPEADFMAQINASQRNTLWLSLGALGVAIALGILTSRWITYPIMRVSQASEDIAAGNLDQHVQPSRIIEIEKLANSFNSMSHQLKNSFHLLKEKNEALRITEENYRSIFENALEGIFQSSPDGRFISVNPAMARMYGYDSPEEMIANVTEISSQVYVNPEGREEFQRHLDKYGKVHNWEYQVYRQDGSIIWVEEDTRAVYDTTGTILYYEGIIQDITERKYKEEQIKRQLEELKIEIDQKKREQEVAKITQSDYFRELQEEAESLRLDDDW
ncbi:putative PAS/PAC sensor protein [Stanieria sp. NIES-3757]|nr:putative PAS/PAC sensor protein [Stanieria sp. NIES-3757]